MAWHGWLIRADATWKRVVARVAAAGIELRILQLEVWILRWPILKMLDLALALEIWSLISLALKLLSLIVYGITMRRTVSE